MTLERIAYLILGVATLGWVALATREFQAEASSPELWLTIATVIGFGLLMVKALRDRAGNEEDRYYDQNVEK
jgi:hypothetical protein